MEEENKFLKENSPGYGFIKSIANYMDKNFGIKLRDIQVFTQILKDSTSSKIREGTKEPKLNDRQFFYGVISNLFDPIGRRYIFTSDFSKRLNYFKRNIILNYICACDPMIMKNFGKTYFQNLMLKVNLSNENQEKKEEIVQILTNLKDQWDKKIDKVQDIITNSRSLQSIMKINEGISADEFNYGNDDDGVGVDDYDVIFDTSSYENDFL